MEIDKIFTLIQDEKQQKAITPWVDSIRKKIKELDDTISQGKLSQKEAYQARDKTKDKLNEALKTVEAKDFIELKNKIEQMKDEKNDTAESNKKIELSSKKIEQLENEIKELVNSKKELEITNKKTILKSQLERDITQAAKKYNLKTQAIPYLLKDLENNAELENGYLVFQNKEGMPMRIDGRSATLDDIIRNKKATAITEKDDMFFNLTPEPSGASDPDKNAGLININDVEWKPDNDNDIIVGRD